MATVKMTTRVYARNGLGQFRAACSAAATATVNELIEDGANISRGLAAVRSGELKGSIVSKMLTRTSGHWYAEASHWGPIEFGAEPHEIVGSPHLAFYWEEAGRYFVPAAVYYNDPEAITIVNHPGNPAQPFLRPAYQIVMPKSLAVADKFYPG